MITMSTMMIRLRTTHWAAPVAAALLALSLGAWTFDFKLSISGDNAEFITLSRSLAKGEGMSYINLPEPTVSTKYPPGFPLALAPISALFGDSVWGDRAIPDYVIMKMLVVLTFAGAGACLFLLARDLVGETGAIAISLVGITNPLMLSFASQVMSEIPYTLWSLLALWLLHRGLAQPGWRDNRWLWAGLAAALMAYYTRSVGICLIAAVIGLMIMRRDWSRALFATVVCAATMAPWSIRNYLVGGSLYMDVLTLGNPYRPELGRLDLPRLLLRMKIHLGNYLDGHLVEATLPMFLDVPAIISVLAVVLASASIVISVYCLWRRRHLLLWLYCALVTITLLLWPWSGPRFLVPIIPICCLLTVDVATEIASRIKARGSHLFRYLGGAAVAVVVLFNAYAMIGLWSQSSADYVPRWRTYYEAALWLRATTPEDKIVSCRKPFWMYVVSGRRSMAFAFDKPEVLLAQLERDGIDYVIVDQLGAPQTDEFLVPAIYSDEGRFREVYIAPRPTTWVLSFDAD